MKLGKQKSVAMDVNHIFTNIGHEITNTNRDIKQIHLIEITKLYFMLMDIKEMKHNLFKE